MPDRYLNYLYNNKYYNTKWLAWESGVSDGHDLSTAQSLTRAVLNKDTHTFDNLDWTTEPQESFLELCKERALRIRDSYSHVALSFSGGSDSYFILDTFLKNNIKLDELVICKDSLTNNSKFNYEIDNLAIPTVKLLTNIKITMLSVDINDFEYIFYDDFMFNYGGVLIPDSFGPAQRLFQPKNGSILINGSWEPVIHLDSELDKYYVNLFDTDGFMTALVNPNVIPFFTDPAFPKLHLKQCHILKNHFRVNKIHIDFNKEYLYYKNTMIKLVRNGEKLNFFSSSPFFDKKKSTANKVDFVGHSKTNYFYKSIAKNDRQLFDYIFTNVSQTFQGIPLTRHLNGVEIGKYYIE